MDGPDRERPGARHRRLELDLAAFAPTDGFAFFAVTTTKDGSYYLRLERSGDGSWFLRNHPVAFSSTGLSAVPRPGWNHMTLAVPLGSAATVQLTYDSVANGRVTDSFVGATFPTGGTAQIALAVGGMALTTTSDANHFHYDNVVLTMQ